MKSRRVILTIEVETSQSLASLCTEMTHVALSRGRWITRYPLPDSIHDEMPERIVQVQANAIRPEPKPKGMVYVSVRPSSMEPVHTGNTTPGPADLIDTTQDGPHPAVSGGKRIRTMKATHIPRGKAKRAKGAK